VAQRCPGRLTSHERPGHLWAEREAVSTPGLEAIVRHEGRLDVLCCILDGGPLASPQISARIGKSARLVRHWLEVLASFDLVEKLGALDGGEPLYAATLDAHPDWVRATVDRHRRD
jgi:hypothetical protein